MSFPSETSIEISSIRKELTELIEKTEKHYNNIDSIDDILTQTVGMAEVFIQERNDYIKELKKDKAELHNILNKIDSIINEIK